MENEKKVGKLELYIQEKKKKCKKFIGEHMWIRDLAMISVGTGLGFGLRTGITIVKEIVKEASNPESSVVEVPGGRIIFESDE